MVTPFERRTYHRVPVLPDIDPERSLSLNEYIEFERSNSSKFGDIGRNIILKGVVLQEIEKNPVIWKSGELRSCQYNYLDYCHIAIVVYKRTGILLTVEAMHRYFRNAKDSLRTKLRKCLLVDKLTLEDTEKNLWKWDAYPFLKYLRHNTADLEKKFINYSGGLADFALTENGTEMEDSLPEWEMNVHDCSENSESSETPSDHQNESLPDEEADKTKDLETSTEQVDALENEKHKDKERKDEEHKDKEQKDEEHDDKEHEDKEHPINDKDSHDPVELINTVIEANQTVPLDDEVEEDEVEEDEVEEDEVEEDEVDEDEDEVDEDDDDEYYMLDTSPNKRKSSESLSLEFSPPSKETKVDDFLDEDIEMETDVMDHENEIPFDPSLVSEFESFAVHIDRMIDANFEQWQTIRDTLNALLSQYEKRSDYNSIKEVFAELAEAN